MLPLNDNFEIVGDNYSGKFSRPMAVPFVVNDSVTRGIDHAGRAAGLAGDYTNTVVYVSHMPLMAGRRCVHAEKWEHQW